MSMRSWPVELNIVLIKSWTLSKRLWVSASVVLAWVSFPLKPFACSSNSALLIRCTSNLILDELN